MIKRQAMGVPGKIDGSLRSLYGTMITSYAGEAYHQKEQYMFEKDCWKDKKYSFFSHTKCECFPCHDTEKPEDFNCLFCYCPLYALKDKCGGNFHYTDSGVKDCSGCALPHKRENFGYIMEKFKEIQEITKL